MNNQKDIQKTDINEHGQPNVPDVKSLSNRVIYEFANKKTEKLVTALYMVSDCMDSDDALKGKLRQLGVELLSDMYKLSTLSPMDKHIHISSSIARVNEILSFVEIAYTIGFISEMNTVILKKEFMILIEELKSHQAKDKHFTFTLDEQMFNVRQPARPHDSSASLPYGSRQGAGGDLVENKRTSFNTIPARPIGVSFTNNKSSLQASQPRKFNSSVTNLTDRQDRTDKIISIIKDLSRNKAEKKDVSIKDISSLFTNCSEKTIQRDLNSLVFKGQLKKTGAKRWSRYSIVS